MACTIYEGVIVHSKAFDGLKGNFPIGFLIWKTDQANIKNLDFIEIKTEILDKNAQSVGEKFFYNLPNNLFLNIWLNRPKANKKNVIPLMNAITPYAKKTSLDKWAEDALGYIWCQNNDLQHASQQTTLFSSTWGGGHGFYVNPQNLWQAAVIFSVRRLIKPTWINDRDQFLQPTEPLTEEFKTDCLIWMLFNGSNLTASANDLE